MVAFPTEFVQGKNMKKRIICLLFIMTFCLVSSSEQISHIDSNLITANQIIYEYFSNIAVTDSIYFRGDIPYSVSYERNHYLLFNSEPIDDFKIIRGSSKTNHYAQHGRTQPDNYIVKLHKDFNNLETFDEQTFIDLLTYISQHQYKIYLKGYNRELVDMPSIMYPITNSNNIRLSTIEYKILLDAYLKSLDNSRDEVIELLRQFYALRLHRWRSQSAFVQTYELSQEKILGLSIYKSYELLKVLETTHPYLFKSIDTESIIMDKLFSIFDGDYICINSMSKNKSENKGFLIASLYNYLDWDYKPETTRDNFHVFLGHQLDVANISLPVLEEIVYNDLLSPEAVVEEYLLNYTNLIGDFNLQIYFDHFTDDFYSNDELHYINSQDRTILYPHVSRYLLQSKWMEIDIKNQSLLYNLDRRNKYLQTNINTNLVLTLDHKIFILDELDEDSVDFTNLFYRSPSLNIWINTPGVLSFKDNVLTITLDNRLDFQVEEEYWDLIDELNGILISRGVPATWLPTNVNHPEFRIYHSIVRHFTQMPEHQVSRGDRDQNWYMQHFGVDEKVRKGIEFRRNNRTALQSAESRHGIHYELLMAIMAIESDYANPRWRGTFYTFPTLVTQYVLLPRRQRFAVNELVALYQFSEKTNNDVYHFIGSFAGAAGWGQFIPTSLNAYFVDSNNDFYDVDIFSIDDTLHSISNYLNAHGLSGRNMGNYQARFRAVRAYNHSDAYVRAVLYIYDELRKQRSN